MLKYYCLLNIDCSRFGYSVFILSEDWAGEDEEEKEENSYFKWYMVCILTILPPWPTLSSPWIQIFIDIKVDTCKYGVTAILRKLTTAANTTTNTTITPTIQRLLPQSSTLVLWQHSASPKPGNWRRATLIIFLWHGAANLNSLLLLVYRYPHLLRPTL